MFAENLDDFFDAVDGHAVVATYDGATAVNVIFDNEYVEAFGVAGTGPAALGKASDFPAGATVGKELIVAGVDYEIVNREPVDDGAIVRLRLKRT